MINLNDLVSEAQAEKDQHERAEFLHSLTLSPREYMLLREDESPAGIELLEAINEKSGFSRWQIDTKTRRICRTEEYYGYQRRNYELAITSNSKRFFIKQYRGDHKFEDTLFADVTSLDEAIEAVERSIVSQLVAKQIEAVEDRIQEIEELQDQVSSLNSRISEFNFAAVASFDKALKDFRDLRNALVDSALGQAGEVKIVDSYQLRSGAIRTEDDFNLAIVDGLVVGLKNTQDGEVPYSVIADLYVSPGYLLKLFKLPEPPQLLDFEFVLVTPNMSETRKLLEELALKGSLQDAIELKSRLSCHLAVSGDWQQNVVVREYFHENKSDPSEKLAITPNVLTPLNFLNHSQTDSRMLEVFDEKFRIENLSETLTYFYDLWVSIGPETYSVFKSGAVDEARAWIDAHQAKIDSLIWKFGS